MSVSGGSLMTMSPEKERELTSKILERAQLAQMTRQLKMGLSKVPTGKSSSNSNSIAVFSSPAKEENQTEARLSRKRTSDEEAIQDALRRMSPLKKHLTKDETSISTLKDYDRPSTPPRVPPSSSASILAEPKEKSHSVEISTTPKAVITQPIFLSAQSDKLLMTPKRNVINVSARVQENGNPNSSDNDVAADLLMYLATSPYVSTKTPYERLPTTPSMSLHINSTSNPNDLDDGENDAAVRFSHIKPSISSPQSTFKQPALITTSGNSMSFTDTLMDSPTLYMTTSPSQKKKSSGIASNGYNTNHLSHIPSTPSRELKSSLNPNAFLLKTPNFNMGNYVHNLFSPSPRVNLSAMSNHNSNGLQVVANHLELPTNNLLDLSNVTRSPTTSSSLGDMSNLTGLPDTNN